MLAVSSFPSTSHSYLDPLQFFYILLKKGTPNLESLLLMLTVILHEPVRLALDILQESLYYQFMLNLHA